MARMIDQIRASKLPSNLMQFAAKGALSVSPAENLEILVYLAKYNKVFGEVARMTLAGWDEKASLKAASDPQTEREVLGYFIAPDNLRPRLLPALLENPSVRESDLVKLAISALTDSIAVMLHSARIRGTASVLDTLKSNPHLNKEQSDELRLLRKGLEDQAPGPATSAQSTAGSAAKQQAEPHGEKDAAGGSALSSEGSPPSGSVDQAAAEPPDEVVTAFFAEHAVEIAAEEGKPFQPIGSIMDLLGDDYFPHSPAAEAASEPVPAPAPAPAASEKPAALPATTSPASPQPVKRVNTVQKINALDVKGRIQLALKGSKEERSILIRDGTKVVSLAVLEAPKLSDGEVEKFASQKNVLEAVLRQIPLKRRFMKNYKVVRNLVSNPRTPLDLGLGLMKNLLAVDLKNISSNKEISETIRKLASKMYEQKMQQANKK
jgi:hypothetical protein